MHDVELCIFVLKIAHANSMFRSGRIPELNVYRYGKTDLCFLFVTKMPRSALPS